MPGDWEMRRTGQDWRLHHHNTEVVYEKAKDIIEKSSGEEEGSGLSTTTNGQAYDLSGLDNMPKGRLSF